MFTLGAFAVIFNEKGEVLLSHRRDRDLWNFPGGGLESRELPDEAVIREVKEETGLEVVVERLASICGKLERDELVFTFVCRVVGGRLTLTDEADQHAFFTVDNLPANTVPRQVERLKDALTPAAQPVIYRPAAPSLQVFLEPREND